MSGWCKGQNCLCSQPHQAAGVSISCVAVGSLRHYSALHWTEGTKPKRQLDFILTKHGENKLATKACRASRLSVAPMMDCTDKHEIYFLSLISKNIHLYTEMIVANAIIRGDRNKLLSFKKISNPVTLQVGGSNSNELAEACKISEDYGYKEINLNLGCPSKKVQKNKFGACLMQEPDLVAKCIETMAKSTKLPITIKTRIGYNEVENFEFLKSFIQTTKDAGSKKFIIHARKALLKKLSPKENLNITPLKYDFVYKLKEYFNNDEIIINGGIKTTQDIKNHLKKVNGVMIGRAIYHSPYFLAEIEKEIFGTDNKHTESHSDAHQAARKTRDDH